MHCCHGMDDMQRQRCCWLQDEGLRARQYLFLGHACGPAGPHPVLPYAHHCLYQCRVLYSIDSIAPEVALWWDFSCWRRWQGNQFSPCWSRTQDNQLACFGVLQPAECIGLLWLGTCLLHPCACGLTWTTHWCCVVCRPVCVHELEAVSVLGCVLYQPCSCKGLHVQDRRFLCC